MLGLPGQRSSFPRDMGERKTTMIRRMGGADAFFLGLETPRAYMHTFKIGILDPADHPEGFSFKICRVFRR